MQRSYRPTLLLILALPVCAEELLRQIELPAAADDGVVTITSRPNQARQLLFELSDPGIALPVYAVTGEIRYDDVRGDGYLQLDNHFGDAGTYFTKSLAASGPMRTIAGSSDWRPFVLPFYAHRANETEARHPTPEKLTLSIHLPGSGTAYVRNIGLHQYAAGEDPLRSPGQWISSRAAILIGAIGGSTIGVWGGLVGFLVSRGKARGLVLASANLMIALGAVSLLSGIAALVSAQPYAIYYPLLLTGVILLAVVGSLRRTLARRYEAAELQKMQAMDA